MLLFQFSSHWAANNLKQQGYSLTNLSVESPCLSPHDLSPASEPASECVRTHMYACVGNYISLHVFERWNVCVCERERRFSHDIYYSVCLWVLAGWSPSLSFTEIINLLWQLTQNVTVFWKSRQIFIATSEVSRSNMLFIFGWASSLSLNIQEWRKIYPLWRVWVIICVWYVFFCTKMYVKIFKITSIPSPSFEFNSKIPTCKCFSFDKAKDVILSVYALEVSSLHITPAERWTGIDFQTIWKSIQIDRRRTLTLSPMNAKTVLTRTRQCWLERDSKTVGTL